MSIRGSDIRERIERVLNETVAQASSHEFIACYYSGEVSDFCRINNSLVRQAGTVEQHYLDIRIFRGSRSATGQVTLSGSPEIDSPRVRAEVSELRSQLDHLPEDPFQFYATEPKSSESLATNALPSSHTILSSILNKTRGHDFVGILASGGIYRAFANSAGQRNWFESYSFNLDWSVYARSDKAAKSSYAGFSWDEAEFTRLLSQTIEQQEVLRRPDVAIKPGKYRVFLSPQALGEVVGILGWGGFGLKALRTKNSTLLKLAQGEAQLHPSVNLSEVSTAGVTPDFDSFGFNKPRKVSLVDGGKYASSLVSARSAKEFGTAPTGSSEWEAPVALEMGSGTLPSAEALARLGNGILVNNLWYLNYSDRVSCRITGMTRFATFLVENGKVTQPLGVMRFDDTIYNMLGTNLEALTVEQSYMLENSTYSQRAIGFQRLPGALLKELSFTL